VSHEADAEGRARIASRACRLAGPGGLAPYFA
jgi:hypothetical protein